MNSPHVLSKPVSNSVGLQESDACLAAAAPSSNDYQCGLSAEAYTCSQYLDRERQTVFSQYWICVGLASNLPSPGDVYPTSVAGMPIVLVRDRNHPKQTGTPPLRAFHNVCRHRGLQLVDKPCNVNGRIQCPYHSWTYKLDGTLKGTPHFGGYHQDSYSGFDRDRKGLVPIRCELDHFGFEVGDPHVGQGSLLYKTGVIDKRSLPTFPNLETLGKQTVAEYITVFPNLMLGIHPDYFLVFLVNPLSPDTSAERMVFYFVGDDAMTPENQTLRHLPIDLWQVTNDEDITMIERMQVGRKSSGFDGGCFSPELEQTVYRFQQAIAKAVGT